MKIISYLFMFAGVGLFAATEPASVKCSTHSRSLDLEAPIATWDDGIPLGNGGAGALLWGGGDTLNVTLDRADFWHNIVPSCYNSPDFTWDTLVDVVAKKDAAQRKAVFDKGESATKLPGVRFVMKLGEGQTLRRFRLDYKTGIATVTVATPQGEREVRAWFDNGDKLLSLHVPEGVSFASKDFVKNPSFKNLGGYPEAEITIDSAKAVYRRARRKGADNRFDTDFEAGVRFCGEGEYSKRTTAKEAEFWARFNAKSSVSIPDADMQRQYDFTMYLYGAGARAGHPPLALQGLWTADNGKLPPWHGDYHNDLNTEMTYWAAGPAGHIEALEAFADFYIERLPECRAFCRKIFKGGDGAVIPPTMGYAAQPILGWTAYTLPPIHGIWVFDTFCDAWDYDPTPEKAAKYLAFGRELAAGLEHSWKVVDGVRKLALSCSPEVGDNRNECFLNANSSYERAILNSFYVWLSRLAEACGGTEEAAKWRSYVGTFGPPNVAADGALEVSAGNPLKATHRHASHLMQVFPLTNVPPEEGVDFAKSVDWWEGLGTGRWCGYSFSWAGCFEARLGRGDRAFRYLKDFQRAFVARNGFHLNGDQLKCGLSRFTYRPFTLEGNFGYARGIQEMLLSYDPHKREVHLFRALPKEWDGKEVAFRNLRVPGGCRISARRAADGKVSFTVDGRLPGPVMHKGKIISKTAFADFVVNGKGAEAPEGYIPAMLSNGSLCTTSDFLGGTPPLTKEMRARKLSTGIFIAGRRLLYNIYGHGRYNLTLSVDGKALDKPDSWSQTLDPYTAKSIVTNVFGDVTRVVETFVAFDRDVIAIRQTFPGTDESRISTGLDYTPHRDPERRIVVEPWEELPDGRAYSFTAYGRHIDKTRITIRNAKEDGAFVTFISYDKQGEKPYAGTYADLAKRHEAAWRKYYSTSSVQIPDAKLMRMRVMAEYQLKCNVTRWALPVGIFPSHWNGNSFAFDELYGMQGLLSAGHFDEARHVADFRFNTLGQAKKRVGGGGRGARWYWECMDDAVREGAPSGHWLDHIFHMSAIAQTCNLTASYTGDIDLLREKMYPVMRECARFYRAQYVYDAADGSSFVGICTDLERLGAAKERPCMTTCGIIHTFRVCADAADKLGVDAAEAADWREKATRLEKSLPVKDGRFVPAANAMDAVSMGTLAGYFPFPIFPRGHKEQTAAVDFFLAKGTKAGNMYAVGKKICPWYAATMAMAALRAGRYEKVCPFIREAAVSAGLFGEYWEINEPGTVQIHPWFMTAAGNCLYAMNQMLLMEADGECRIGAGVPKEWKDWSFRLPAESGYEVEFAMKAGKITKLVLREPSGRARSPSGPHQNRRVNLVLPDGSHRAVLLDQKEVVVISD